MVKFIILSDNRSGSHFVQRSLDNHEKITCYWELFWGNHPPGYNSYINTSFSKKLLNSMWKTKSVSTWLDNLFTPENAKGNEALGFSLKYGQAKKYSGVLDWAKKNDTKTIHLIRTNYLMRFIACKSRGRYESSLPTTQFEPVKIELDPKETIDRIKGNIRAVSKMRNKWNFI